MLSLPETRSSPTKLVPTTTLVLIEWIDTGDESRTACKYRLETAEEPWPGRTDSVTRRRLPMQDGYAACRV